MSEALARRVMCLVGVGTLMAWLVPAAALASPEGRSTGSGSAAILLHSDRDDAPGWYVVDSDGTELRLLVEETDPEAFSDASWSPDGALLAFERAAGFDQSGLYVLQLGTGSIREVVAPDAMGDESLVSRFGWSPTATSIVVGWYRYPGDGPMGVVSKEGGPIRLLPVEGRGPVWSPAGDWIAFNQRREDENGDRPPDALYVVRPDGTGLRQLGVGTIGAWSPTGDAIATTLRDGDSSRVVLWPLDGGTATQVGPASASSCCIELAWSPDGARLAISEELENDLTRLWIVPRDGSQARLVGPPVEWVAGLSWSPTGLWLAFTGPPQAAQDEILWSVDTETGSIHTWSELDPRLDLPVWSPGGSRLAVSVDAPGKAADLWVVEPGSGAFARVTRGTEYGYRNQAPAWHPAGLGASALGGAPAEHAVPSAWQPAAQHRGMLETRCGVEELAADDGLVAALTCGDGDVVIWDRPRRQAAWFANDLSEGGVAAVALAGERATYLTWAYGLSRDYWSLSWATPTRPRPVWVDDLPSSDDEYASRLAGDGDLTVLALTRPPKALTTVWRIDSDDRVRIGSVKGTVDSLSVDGDRAAVATYGGAVAVFERDEGAITRFHVPGRVNGVALDGHRLLVATGGQLRVYHAATRILLRALPLPPSARLEDAAAGIATYVVGNEVHALRLSDRRDTTVTAARRGPVHSQIEPTGLYYSYSTPTRVRPGRIAFVPLGRLFR